MEGEKRTSLRPIEQNQENVTIQYLNNNTLNNMSFIKHTKGHLYMFTIKSSKHTVKSYNRKVFHLIILFYTFCLCYVCVTVFKGNVVV